MHAVLNSSEVFKVTSIKFPPQGMGSFLGNPLPVEPLELDRALTICEGKSQQLGNRNEVGEPQNNGKWMERRHTHQRQDV